MGISRLPFASFIAASLLLILSGCGGEPLVFNGNPAPSSATSESSEISTASISSANTTSSMTSTSTASSVITSQSSSIGNSQSSSVSSSTASSSSLSSSAPTGRDLFNSATLGCSTCHGPTGSGGTSGFDIIVSDWTTATMTTKIRTTMPPQNEPAYVGKTCNLDCAQKITAYIMGGYAASADVPGNLLQKQAATSPPSNSLISNAESDCGAAYSTNNLRPLTKQEYSAAIFQLAGIDVIGALGQNTYDALPPDGAVTTFDTAAQQSYSAVANKVTANLASKNFAGIVDCTNLSSEHCYNRLIEDFACKAFKRPLTAAERSRYLSIYTNGNSTDAIKDLAAAILSSENFIYRSNIGLSLIYRDANANSTLALTSAASLIKETTTLAIYENSTLNANFSGNDILEISVKSTQGATGLWPVMRVQVGQSTFVDLIANQGDATYRFHITGLTGNNSIAITHQATGAPLEYQAGHTLKISSVKLALSY